jgi:hypothetical protein
MTAREPENDVWRHERACRERERLFRSYIKFSGDQLSSQVTVCGQRKSFLEKCDISGLNNH